MKTDEDYRKIINSLKRRKNGAAIADLCAATALPLSKANELALRAVDEYSGHLRVTSSGEILYHFPNGFINRYRGFGAVFNRFLNKTTDIIKKTLSFLFKIWIMVMLVGYFILFVAIALASVIIQIAGRSDGKGGGKGGINFGLFDIFIRIWFYSEITRVNKRAYPHDFNQKTKNKRPMHKAIFSFVFGEEDPNRNWNDIKNRAIIEFLQANNGVISLAEYMAFSGESSIEAEESILSFCVKFEGSPEITEDSTVVYRFEKLLLRSGKEGNDKSGLLIPPVKRLKIFSVNKKNQNILFVIINAVNLLFGSYFFYQSNVFGHLADIVQYQAAPVIYAYTHYFLQFIMIDPSNFIRIALGIVPLAFSILFWIIPLIRYFLMKKNNSEIKLSNFKRFGFNRIWALCQKIEKDDFKPASDECSADNLQKAFDRVILDISAVSNPEIEITDNGKTVYSFKELEKEKMALEKYRKNIDMSKSQLGDTVFDSAM